MKIGLVRLRTWVWQVGLLTCALLAGCGRSSAPAAGTSSSASPLVAASGSQGGAAAGSAAAPAAILVVAAENFYGDVASQIGGQHVKVTSILSDPSIDPHLYESNVDNAKAIANARLVIKNGVGYDAFMDKLLAASPQQGRLVVDAPKLTGAADDANPHLWYDPKTMPLVAQAIADDLGQLDPADRADFDAAVHSFDASLKPLQDQIAAIRAKHAGVRLHGRGARAGRGRQGRYLSTGGRSGQRSAGRRSRAVPPAADVARPQGADLQLAGRHANHDADAEPGRTEQRSGGGCVGDRATRQDLPAVADRAAASLAGGVGTEPVIDSRQALSTHVQRLSGPGPGHRPHAVRVRAFA